MRSMTRVPRPRHLALTAAGLDRRAVLAALIASCALACGTTSASTDHACHHHGGGHELAPDAPSESVYRLAMKLVDQDGRDVTLDAHRGGPVVMAMFYASCTSACPLLIAQLKAADAQLTPAERTRTRFVLVSLDPERDTPQALSELARRHALDLERWSLERAGEADVRRLAAVLGVKYRKLPNGDYNHSSVITVLDREGVARARQEGPRQPAEPIAQAVRAVLGQDEQPK